MALIIEILFVVILFFLLTMIYLSEKTVRKNRYSRAAIEECWDGKERRKHIRFRKSLDVTYVVEKKMHLKNNARTIDISEGGARLMIDKKLGKGTILDMKIDIPGSKEAAEIEARVVWCEEMEHKESDDKRLFCTGIQFAAVKEPSRLSLKQYLHSLPCSA